MSYLLDPQEFVKRLMESGIAFDSGRIVMMELLPSTYPKRAVMRVEYELDERFFEEPKAPEVIVKINGTVTRETLEEMRREIERALAAHHRKQGRSK